MKKLAPIPPGEIIEMEYMEPLGLTAYRVSKDLGIPQTRMGQVLKGKRAITADLAMRLAKYFGTSAQFWMNLQAHYDLEKAEDEGTDFLEGITPLKQAG